MRDRRRGAGSGAEGTAASDCAPGKRTRTGGVALASPTRAWAEPAFGADLGKVRVHAGAEAAEEAAAHDANALADGQDIVLGAGHDPAGEETQWLIAHEIAHTLQQGEAGDDVQDDPGAEREADAAADAVTAGGIAPPLSPATAGIRRHRGAPPATPPRYRPALVIEKPSRRALLGSSVAVTGVVSNASQVPRGRTLRWHADPPSPDGLQLGPATPATGPRTTWVHGAAQVGTFTSSHGVTAVDPRADLPARLPTDPRERIPSAAPYVPHADQVVTIEVPQPRVRWALHVDRGNTGGDRPRSLARDGVQKLYRNDRVTVTAHLADLADGRRAGIIPIATQGGATGEVSNATWIDARTVEWTVTATQPGHLDVSTVLKIPGAERLAHDQKYQVVMDLTDLVVTCTAASERAKARFHRAASHLSEASAAYREAHAKHLADLKDARAAGELIGQLLLGVFFAALGGAAGGAVGNLIKAKLGKATADEAFGGALIDAGKDTVKFAVRAFPSLRPAAGSKLAAGEDPVAWSASRERALHDEAAMLHDLLAKVLSRARDADRDTEFADLDGDPVRSIEEDPVLGALESVSTDPRHYSKELWKTWLEHHAHEVVVISDHLIKGKDVSVREQMNGTLRAHIRTAAAAVGEDGDEWISRHGTVSFLAAHRKKERLEHDLPE